MEDLFAPRIVALHEKLSTLLAYEQTSRDSLDSLVPACDTMIARALAGCEAQEKKVTTLWLIGYMTAAQRKQLSEQLVTQRESLQAIAVVIDKRRIDLNEALVGMMLTIEAAVAASNKIARILQARKDAKLDTYPDDFEIVIQEAENLMREQEGVGKRLRLTAIRIAEEMEEHIGGLHVNNFDPHVFGS